MPLRNTVGGEMKLSSRMVVSMATVFRIRFAILGWSFQNFLLSHALRVVGALDQMRSWDHFLLFLAPADDFSFLFQYCTNDSRGEPKPKFLLS